MESSYKSKLNVYRLDANLQKLASNFKCGNDNIDDFLKTSKALDNGIGITYVWLSEDEDKILGYYNFTTGSLDTIDSDLRIKSGGAIHLNEFAMDISCHGISVQDVNMSDLLLYDFISRATFIRDNYVGYSFITLRSTSQGYNLYKRHDFEDVEEDMDFSPTMGKDSDGGSMMYLPLGIEEVC